MNHHHLLIHPNAKSITNLYRLWMNENEKNYRRSIIVYDLPGLQSSLRQPVNNNLDNHKYSCMNLADN